MRIPPLWNPYDARMSHFSLPRMCLSYHLKAFAGKDRLEVALERTLGRHRTVNMGLIWPVIA